MRKTRLICLMMLAGAVSLGGCEGLATRSAVVPTQAISDLVLPAEKAGQAVTEEHFVMNWLVLGPITFKESDFGGEHQQPAADQKFVKNEGGLDGTQTPPEGAAWQEKTFTGGGPAGCINLDALYRKADHVAAYAVAWLKCPADVKDAKLYVGSDDYIKVWINGKLVHTYRTERRAAKADQDCIGGIALKKGYNRVVVKCVDVVLGWNFYLRLTDAKDRPMVVKAAAKAE
jgi:hypothetical protein